MSLFVVTKVKPGFFKFENSEDCRRVYNLLMNKIDLEGELSLACVEKVIRDTVRWRYDSGHFPFSTNDYIPRIQEDDIVMREYSDTYATIYIKGYNEEDETPEKTIKEFADELQEEFLVLLKKWSKENPHLRSDLKNMTVVINVTDGGVSKPKIYNEVKE